MCRFVRWSPHAGSAGQLTGPIEFDYYALAMHSICRGRNSGPSPACGGHSPVFWDGRPVLLPKAMRLLPSGCGTDCTGPSVGVRNSPNPVRIESACRATYGHCRADGSIGEEKVPEEIRFVATGEGQRERAAGIVITYVHSVCSRAICLTKCKPLVVETIFETFSKGAVLNPDPVEGSHFSLTQLADMHPLQTTKVTG